MSSVSGKNHSADRPFIAASSRKFKRSRAKDFNAIQRVLDSSARKPIVC
jgi:hypothetical protein